MSTSSSALGLASNLESARQKVRHRHPNSHGRSVEGIINTTCDAFLDGRVSVKQPEKGFRSGLDAVFMAAACSAKGRARFGGRLRRGRGLDLSLGASSGHGGYGD